MSMQSTEREPENFIPWSQLEPLIEPGMTGPQFAVKVREMLGLPGGIYQLRVPAPHGHRFKDLAEALRYGIVIEKLGASPIYQIPGPVISGSAR